MKIPIILLFNQAIIQRGKAMKVESRIISSISYDEDYKTLEITFHRTGQYQYYDVPKDVWDRFSKSPSKGEFFHQEIKKRFNWQKVVE